MMIYARLENRTKQKYGLFHRLSLSLVGACEMSLNPHIFLSRAKKHIQEINRHLNGTLNIFGTMVFAANQEQNRSYIFKDMLLQPYKSYLILTMLEEFEAHKLRSHWTLTKNSEVDNNHKNKDGKLKTILYIWSFKRMKFSDRGLMKRNARLFTHGVIQQCGAKYWETYATVLNWISVRSLLAKETVN